MCVRSHFFPKMAWTVFICTLDTAEANINDLDTDFDQSCRHFFQILINLTVNTEWWINRINVCLKPMISNLFLLKNF